MTPPITPPDRAILDVLKRYWGYDTLRPLQAEAIAAGLHGRDSLVVMPTGGGKSLCYQIPAVLAGRLDVVISPLIALMKDQVDGLRACGYPAAALHSNLTTGELRTVEGAVLAGQLRLLFLAPERLQNPYIQGMLERARVRAFTIDEAHCISQWGHDFRKEYRQLARLRATFPEASLHAYTATATARVRADIAEQLQLRAPTLLVGRFDRPNLIYRVLPKTEIHSQVASALARHAGEAAIVYCLSRVDTQDMAAYLRGRGLRAAHYHAGMCAEARRATQDAFAREELDVISATVAFGMGIDRSDVRCVIHATMPKSIEHYQQETGRAGRDGLAAECVLFYDYSDLTRWEGLIKRSAAQSEYPTVVTAAMTALLQEMQQFCVRGECRHAALSAYFGQRLDVTNCGACDVCLGEVAGLTDVTVTAQKILSCVARVGERFGVAHLVDVLTGRATPRVQALGHDQLSTFALLKDDEPDTVRQTIYQLLDQGLVQRSPGEYPVLQLNTRSWEVLRGQRPVRLREITGPLRKTRVEADGWAGVDRKVFDALRALRKEIARERGIPAFTILHDATLRELARIRPTTVEQLPGIRGLGERKRAEFGAQLVECVRGASGASAQPAPSARRKVHSAAELSVSGRRRKPSLAQQRAFELFRAGRPLSAVAEEIQRAHATTWQYLLAFVEQEPPATLSPWVDEDMFARVTAAFATGGDERFGTIFERLGGRVPYEVIRLVAAFRGQTST
ncbi:MAG: DNA helicase RecQ [Phycisphaerales bacterium]|nr:DNA helicase RecQ [Phycisphaerales bacterium]